MGHTPQKKWQVNSSLITWQDLKAYTMHIIHEINGMNNTNEKPKKDT